MGCYIDNGTTVSDTLADEICMSNLLHHGRKMQKTFSQTATLKIILFESMLEEVSLREKAAVHELLYCIIIPRCCTVLLESWVCVTFRLTVVVGTDVCC